MVAGGGDRVRAGSAKLSWGVLEGDKQEREKYKGKGTN